MCDHLKKIAEEHDGLDMNILNGRDDDSYFNFDFLLKANKVNNRMDIVSVQRFTKEQQRYLEAKFNKNPHWTRKDRTRMA